LYINTAEMSKQTSTPQVTSADQRMISDFSKHYVKRKELGMELKAYLDMNEKLKDCAESLDEVELEGGDAPVQ